MLWDVEYPQENQLLFANLGEATGWCLHPSEQIESVDLVIDGRVQSRATLGHPRMDVACLYPKHEDRAMLSGFRCEFDSTRLRAGRHTFEFRVKTAVETAVLTRSALKVDDGPVLVTDVFIDIVGHCNLRCAMCPHGDLEGIKSRRENGVMPPLQFESVLRHLLDQGFIRDGVNLYNWGEPLLHPELSEILDICRRLGVKAIISSNFSVPQWRLDALRRHRIDLLMISLSGFSPATYAVNHRGGQFARVFRNLEALASRRETIRTVLIKYLVFDYNAHEIESASRFAQDHGFEFGAYAGTVPSLESFLCDSQTYARTASQYVGSSVPRHPATHSCPQQTKIIVDHQGRLEHCSMAWDRPYARSVLDADLRRYFEDRLKCEACQRCLQSGYSYYRHFGAYSPDLLKFCTARGD